VNTLCRMALLLVGTLGACVAMAPPNRHVTDAHAFDKVAQAALSDMREKAYALGIGGVAVVAYFEGDPIDSWVSRMLVVGRYKDSPTQKEPGANLLAIVYSKAAEMADTHKESGSQVRPPMTGEVGWPGGVIARGRHGYILAAFSGGEDKDDLQVSRTGLARLATGL
jgi:hypothetical protein